MTWVCVLSHNTPLQLTLPHFEPRVFAPSLVSATQMFNSFLPPSEAINAEALLLTLVTQKSLSSKLDDYLFKVLLDMSSITDKARLLSVTSPHAGSWLSVTPSEGLGLHLDPSQFQIAIKWWLGLDLSCGSCCPLCPEIALDPLGHHAVTCKRGGDVVPATTICMISLRSPAGELIWVSRWKWVTISPITATPVQLTF